MQIRLRALSRGPPRNGGYVEGQNVKIEYLWAEAHTGRLPELAAGLVRDRVAVLVAAGGTASAVAAKAATREEYPIVFGIRADDPVEGSDLSPASIGRAATRTGVTSLNIELAPKRLELLYELLPRASRITVLVNPASVYTQTTVREVEAAGRAIGFQTQIVNAGTSRAIDTAFAAFARERPDAVFLGQDPFFNGRRLQLANWAARHALPAIYALREFAEAGGVMSYGSNFNELFRQAGTYAGRSLPGSEAGRPANPARRPSSSSSSICKPPAGARP